MPKKKLDAKRKAKRKPRNVIAAAEKLLKRYGVPRPVRHKVAAVLWGVKLKLRKEV